MTSLELDLTPLIDQLVERIVTEVTERLAERHFGPATVETAAPEPNATSAVEIPQPMSHSPSDKAAAARAHLHAGIYEARQTARKEANY